MPPQTLQTEPNAAEITRASKSNLALAFVALPRERREDISVFYAFCRVIDDIADDLTQGIDERRAALRLWHRSLLTPVPDEPALAAPVRALIAKYRIDPTLFQEIIAGCEMDLDGVRYETWDDLRVYCHRVASVVGLVSIEIFGCHHPSSRRYATELGLALQLTNILRDVGEDFFENGARIYLPREDMTRFGYTAEDLANRVQNDAFRALMNFEAERALTFYESAAAELPPADRRALIAAEIMRSIYRRLLDRMQHDGFRVFEQRYRVSKLEKLATIVRVFARSALA